MTEVFGIKDYELIKLLERNGFAMSANGSSPHKKMVKGNITLPIPIGHRTIAPGTLRSILKRANIDFSQAGKGYKKFFKG